MRIHDAYGKFAPPAATAATSGKGASQAHGTGDAKSANGDVAVHVSEKALALSAKSGVDAAKVARLKAAIDHVRAMGAPGIEAYPIDPEGQRIDVAFGFTGFTSMFEAEGFRRAMLTDGHSAGRPRWLMRLDFD